MFLTLLKLIQKSTCCDVEENEENENIMPTLDIHVNMPPLDGENESMPTMNEDDHASDCEINVCTIHSSPLPHNEFLPVDALISKLGNSIAHIDEIPRGKKENIFFVVKNENNIINRKVGKQSTFWDDCGSWEKGVTNKSHFVKGAKGYTKVVYRNNCFN